MIRFIIISLLLFISTNASASDYRKAQNIVEQSTFIVYDFANDPDYEYMSDNIKNAKAVLIIPQNLRGGFIFGGSGGTGVLIAKNDDGTWSQPAFYTLASLSVGLQIGGDASQLVLLIMTENGMNSLLATSFKLGADVSVAAGPVGGGAKAATTDVLAYSKSKGLFGGAAIEGSVVTVRDSLNSAYYKRPVNPVDIIVRKTVTNPDADIFRHTVSELAKGVNTYPAQSQPTFNEPSIPPSAPLYEEEKVILPSSTYQPQTPPAPSTDRIAPTTGGVQVFE